MTMDATVNDLEWLFHHTPANLIVVSYDVWKEESTEISVTVGRAARRLNRMEKIWDVLYMNYGAIFAKTTRFSAVAEKLSIGGDGPHRFICCDCDIRESR